MTDLVRLDHDAVALLGADLLATKARYDELIFAVANKYPGESRHETALRYIRAMESLESRCRNHCPGDGCPGCEYCRSESVDTERTADREIASHE